MSHHFKILTINNIYLVLFVVNVLVFMQILYFQDIL